MMYQHDAQAETLGKTIARSRVTLSIIMDRGNDSP
jgi:hypothetical protein